MKFQYTELKTTIKTEKRGTALQGISGAEVFVGGLQCSLLKWNSLYFVVLAQSCILQGRVV
jgi:hypothetical protein